MIQDLIPATSALSFSTAAPSARSLNLSHEPPNPKAETPARISLACMTCRSRKVRCNGETPCSSCIASNRECVFDQAKSKRRRKAAVVHHASSKNGRLIPYSSPSHHNATISSFQPHSVTLDPHSKHFRSCPLVVPVLRESAVIRVEDDSPTSESSKTSCNAAINTANSPSFSSEDDSSSPICVPIRVPYFRFLGPTAIAPGAPFREISMKLVREDDANSSDPCHRAHSSSTDRPATASNKPPSIGRVGSSPPPHACDGSNEVSFTLTESEFRHNLDVFYDHMGSFLSCMRKEDVLHSLSHGTVSEALKLAISALAECIEPSSSTVDHAELRSRRAKSLCVPHLSLPSLDTTYTLLLIAYCEFARDKDSGLWMWSGLALRMATDLGLHKSTIIPGNHENSSWEYSESGLRQRLFWSCYHLDRLISSGTGRVTTLLDSEIDIPLPPLYTIPIDEKIFGSKEEILSPHHHITQILILLGKISDTFNRSKINLSESAVESPAKSLRRFRAELHTFYSGLPPILHFTVENARRYHSVKQGQAFLLLHIWFHSLVVITHNPTSVGPGWSSLDSGLDESTSLEWSRGSVRTISDMIQFVNILDHDIYRSVPFASQPIMIAGLASIPLNPHALDQSNNPNKLSAWRDFEICLAALRTMQSRWRGVSWLISTLQSRASYEHDVDLSATGGAEVSTCDSSLMNKLVEKTEAAFCIANEKNSRQVVGLSASGTFNEPATGRLSLVRQPDMPLHNASLLSTSVVPILPDEQDSSRSWQSSVPLSDTLSSGNPQTSSGVGMLNSEHINPPQFEGPHTMGTQPFDVLNYPVAFENTPMADTKKSQIAADQALVPEVALLSSSWTTPVPQIYWPDVTSFGCYLGQTQDGREESQGRSNVSAGSVAGDEASGGAKVELRSFILDPSQQPSSPILDKEIWDELFQGERGVWSSFQLNSM